MAYREPGTPPQWQGQQQGYQGQPGYGQQYQQAPWGGAQYPPDDRTAPVFQPGYQEPPPQLPPPPGPPQRPGTPRKRPVKAVLLAVGALIVGIIIGSAAGSSGKTPAAAAPAPAVTVTVTATPSVAAKTGHAKTGHAKAKTTPSATPSPTHSAAATSSVIATFSGSGIQNTTQFTAPGTWKLDWTYDCSSFGSNGNFIVDEDGGNDFGGASVNELGAGGSGSTMAYNDAGTHYLSVNSECSWTLKVISES
jgi:hypothetical protein